MRTGCTKPAVARSPVARTVINICRRWGWPSPMSDIQVTKAEMSRRIITGYDALKQLLSTWTDEQLVTPGGPDGWSVKDHLAHLAVWERGEAAILRHEDQLKAMGLDINLI